MSLISKIDHTAIRRRLAHDIRASLFNIDGFIDELRSSLQSVDKIVADHKGDLPPDFVNKLSAVIHQDTASCMEFLECATAQLHERTDMLTASADKSSQE